MLYFKDLCKLALNTKVSSKY